MPYDDGQECPYYGGIRLKATTNTHAAPRKNASAERLGRTFGDSHKVKLGRNDRKQMLDWAMASGLWVSQSSTVARFAEARSSRILR